MPRKSLNVYTDGDESCSANGNVENGEGRNCDHSPIRTTSQSQFSSSTVSARSFMSPNKQRLEDILKTSYQIAKRNVSTRFNDMAQTLQDIKLTWNEQDEIMKMIQNPTIDEARIDLEAINETSTFVGNATKNLCTSTLTFHASEFATKIRFHLYDKPKYKETLASLANLYLNRGSSICSIMLLNANLLVTEEMPKQKPQRVPKKKDPEAVLMQPTAVTETTQKDAAAMRLDDIYLSLILGFIKNRKRPLNLFAFAMHPEDFSISVENLFYLSFLVRDGLAYTSEEGGILVVYPVCKAKVNDDEEVKALTDAEMKQIQTLTGKGRGADKAKLQLMQASKKTRNKVDMRKQGWISLTLEDWAHHVVRWNITEPAILSAEKSVSWKNIATKEKYKNMLLHFFTDPANKR